MFRQFRKKHHCIKCIYTHLDFDSPCDKCGYEICDYHISDMCYKCFNDERENITEYIMLNMFIEDESAFLKMKDLVDVPLLLEKIMVHCFMNKKYEKIDTLLKLGADINFDWKKYNPNFTLVDYFMERNNFDIEFMNILRGNNYKFNNKVLENEIESHVRCGTSKETIIKLLDFGFDISTVNFNNIAGVEYSDNQTGNHYWRRKIINWLIEKGITYQLNGCIRKNHPLHEKCKLLKNTRLGWYLIHREMVQSIKH